MTTLNAIRLRNATSIYFGKIVSRADFVKSTSGAKTIDLIDSWVARGMETLMADPDWKVCYDSTGPVDFLIMGTRKTHAVCGSMAPGRDASSRRFPFIAATVFEVDEPLPFFRQSPLILARHINRQRTLVQHATASDDPGEALAELNKITPEPEYDTTAVADDYQRFLAGTTVNRITELLSAAHGPVSVRQMVLAIGYLLQPLRRRGAAAPQRGLSLPLPDDPACNSLFKALWLDLIVTFLADADFELTLFSTARNDQPKLMIAFNGVAPAMLQSLFAEKDVQQHWIDLCGSSWIDELAFQDNVNLRLSSYLEHGQLSLRQLVETFRQGYAPPA